MRALVITFAATLLAACGPELSEAQQYAGPWLDPSGEVMRVLAQNSIEGCGEFYQKPHVSSPAEYVVACTRDGATWRGYLVFTATGQVMGPDDMLVYRVGGAPDRNSN